MITNIPEWAIADRETGSAFAPLTAIHRLWDETTLQWPFRATTVEECAAWRAALRAAVQAHLGRMPEALPAVPRVLAEGELEPGVQFRYGEMDSAPGMTIPFMALIPASLSAPTPGVLCVHGHGDGMNPLFGLDAAGNPVEHDYQRTFALEACRRGFVALAFDMLCFGRRRDFAYCAQYNVGPCDLPSKLAQQLGSSMLGLRVFDARRMLDVLGTLPEVDAERIGMAGISGGGTITFFTTLLDDRVRAAMISGYFNQFNAFMRINHCIDNFVPGLSTVAEMPDMGCAIAPRPLLISQGVRDPIFPIAATRAGVDVLRRAYRLFDAEQRLEEEYYDDEHVFSNARVWDFFHQWFA